MTTKKYFLFLNIFECLICLRDHSTREIERTHHLIAIDNIYHLYKNNHLSESEKDEIYERFKS